MRKSICTVAIHNDRERLLYSLIENHDPSMPSMVRRFCAHFAITPETVYTRDILYDDLITWVISRGFNLIDFSHGKTGKSEHTQLMIAALDEYIEILYNKNSKRPRIRILSKLDGPFL